MAHKKKKWWHYFIPSASPVKEIQRAEKVGRSVALTGKEVARFNARVETKVAPVAVPIASFIAGLFTFGLGGEAVAAIGYGTTDYQAKVAGRGRGLHGRANNAQARSEAKRVGIYAAITGAIGGLIGAIFSAPASLFGSAAAPAAGVSVAGAGADVLPEVAVASSAATASTGILGTGITWQGLFGALGSIGGIVQKIFPGLFGGTATAAPDQLSQAAGTGGAIGGGAGDGGAPGTGDFSAGVDQAVEALKNLPTGVKLAAAGVAALGLGYLALKKG